MFRFKTKTKLKRALSGTLALTTATRSTLKPIRLTRIQMEMVY